MKKIALGNRNWTFIAILSVFLAGSALAEGGNCSGGSSDVGVANPRVDDGTSSDNSDSDVEDDGDDDTILDEVDDVVDAADDAISTIDDALDADTTEDEYDDAVEESEDALDELEELVQNVSSSSEISPSLRRGLRASDVAKASNLVGCAGADDAESFQAAARRAAFRASVSSNTSATRLRAIQRSALKTAVRKLGIVRNAAKKIKSNLEQDN